jgi:sulfur carrier protein
MPAIILNGKSQETTATTIGALLDELNLQSLGLVVEHNGAIIKHEQWPTVQLQGNDCVELITFVGGG